MQKGGYVYIMCSVTKSTLYVGVTSNLSNRVAQHRNKVDPTSFTAKYNCIMLVYYQAFDRIEDAIVEEKRIKAGNRVKKELMIESMNLEWKDLWESILD